MLAEPLSRRTEVEQYLSLLNEKERRLSRKRQARRGGLIEFVRHFWHVLEPETELVEGWPLDGLCDHLEAIHFGEITRLLANVSPGSTKSLITNVFFPAWEWGPMDMPHLRYVTFSYASSLTERDNGRFRDLLVSPDYQHLWGHKFKLRKVGEVKVTNDKTGWKLATSVGGVGTGERGDRVLLDDPHNVKDIESDIVRNETVRWFRESMSNRLNDIENSAIVIIMQRLHEEDISGIVTREDFDYCHYMVQMEYDPEMPRAPNAIGWIDPRSIKDDLCWPARFPAETVAQLKRELGPFAWAGQYQQTPHARGGAIIQREYWQPWEAKQYPRCSFVLAVLDTASTVKQINDPSGLTIWGVFPDANDNPRVILLYAWTGRLEIHDLVVLVANICVKEGRSKEDLASALKSLQKDVPNAKSVYGFEVDRLLIEGKANGLSVAHEIKRLYSHAGFGTEIVDPSKWGDKLARLLSVQHMFADGMVFAPDTVWAEKVIEQIELFPKGAHDEYVDCTSMALRYLRLTGLALRKDEHARNVADELMFKSRERPLYS